jgi:hypothetical protein
MRHAYATRLAILSGILMIVASLIFALSRI